MSDKSNNSVLKLVGNKLFITLLVFAVSIIMVSAIFTRNARKVSQQQTDEIGQEIVAVSETESEDIIDQPAVEETVSFMEQVESVAVAEVVSYKMPIAGELQKKFSVDELLWDETMEDWRTHCGIDIASEIGSEVDTAAEGTVIEVQEDEMYGIVVKVQHSDGVITVYKNLGKSVVNKGDVLDEGQMIGTVGNTGSFEMAQKPHLHFEVILEEKYKNPLEFIK